MMHIIPNDEISNIIVILIDEGLIGQGRCYETGKLINANETFYVIGGKTYDISVDKDEITKKVSNNIYTSFHEAMRLDEYNYYAPYGVGTNQLLWYLLNFWKVFCDNDNIKELVKKYVEKHSPLQCA